ncbi:MULTISPECIES: helix-turn-helix domain-containing protein [unclassified Exiguobacterium]|uniref:helix-turn-helix domain-containing protein n=1 Tax=unclassified Exiguobacterium TaxID=2644629 RepID=UPI001BE9753E|nr:MULTISPECIES: helix-turn-helix transcriptional regulator [unclassified Exiguobacterium]
MLGQRIKSLRKAKKMTQSDVADGIMTKSMLSMIENGKATPSLPALQAIARRLHVSIDELLIDPRAIEMKQLIEKINARTNDYYAEEQIADMLAPYLEPAIDSYWQGRIYEMYGNALRFSNTEQGLHYFDLAEEIYKRLELRDEQMNVQISKVYFLFFLRRYEEAYRKVDAMMIYQDVPLAHETFLDYQMLQAIRVSVNEDNWSRSIEFLREGIHYMREKGVYSDVSNYHRLLALFLSLDGDFEAANHELEILEHFFLFTEATAFERILVELTKGSIAVHREDYEGVRYARERLVEVNIEACIHYIGYFEIYLCLWKDSKETLPFDLQSGVANIWRGAHLWQVGGEYDHAMMLYALALAMRAGVGVDRQAEVEEMTKQLSPGRFKQEIEQILAELS